MNKLYLATWPQFFTDILIGNLFGNQSILHGGFTNKKMCLQEHLKFEKLLLCSYHFSDYLSWHGVLNKDPNVWLDGTRPTPKIHLQIYKN
jgi:hypothetical protein